MNDRNTVDTKTREFEFNIELDHGILRYEFFNGTAVIALALWGDDRQGETEAFQERWQKRLAGIL